MKFTAAYPENSDRMIEMMVDDRFNKLNSILIKSFPEFDLDSIDIEYIISFNGIASDKWWNEESMPDLVALIKNYLIEKGFKPKPND